MLLGAGFHIFGNMIERRRPSRLVRELDASYPLFGWTMYRRIEKFEYDADDDTMIRVPPSPGEVPTPSITPSPSPGSNRLSVMTSMPQWRRSGLCLKLSQSFDCEMIPNAN